jgi:orotate phosphoribosyltransferase
VSRKPEASTLTPDEVLALFEEKGALLRGHFLLTSGLHSDAYLQCALVLQYPDIAERIGASIARLFADAEPDCVVSPAVGGIVIGQEVARSLGVRAMFTERESNTMTLRRGFSVAAGERVLVVEDITTTGGSVQEVVDAAARAGATVVGVGAIIDRSGGKARFNVPFKPLACLEVATFSEAECPLCRQGTPACKPGSRKS